VIAWLLKRTSECAWLPLCCRLIRRNDSNGILSARPCACLEEVRPPTALASLDVAVVWGLRPPTALASLDVAVVWGVTK
jgi:hypothetical protein